MNAVSLRRVGVTCSSRLSAEAQVEMVTSSCWVVLCLKHGHALDLGMGGQEVWLPAPTSALSSLGLWTPGACMQREGGDKGGRMASVPQER